MPTIDQLAPATSASDTDEFIVSQGGVVRSITRSQVLNGVQAQLALPPASLLGRVSAGTGAPEVITVGKNLSLSGGIISATAAPFAINGLPAGAVPAGGDLVSISQGGINVSVTFGQLLNGFPGVAGVDVSRALVTPSGATAAQTLAALTGKMMPILGGSLTGTTVLVGSPTTPGQAANKAYVDQQVATTLPLTGGSLNGPLTLAAAPQQPLHSATKAYVDAATASAVPIAGGSMSGALLLGGDPASASQAATKRYADLKLSRTGDTLTGVLALAADPALALQAATKNYVDTQVATTLPRAGGTLTGALSLAFDPTMNAQAATKQYADQRLLRTGDTLSGPLLLAGDPAIGAQAATKNYVDLQTSASVLRVGASMTGALLLASDPALPLHASTKQYVDLRVARVGDTLTGPLYLAADPIYPLQAATKRYIDTQAGLSLTKAGGTFTGPVTLAGDPLMPLQASTKNYVDQQASVQLPRSGGTLTGSLGLNADPVSPNQAATKHYVDAQALATLPLTGGTLAGALSLSTPPTMPLQAATKQYVDVQVASALPVSGGSLTGTLSLAAAPTSPLHAATKLYVDANPAATGVINVSYPPYGAKLNGVTDDTAAFRAAYLAAPSGSAIYVPYGTTVLQQPGTWGTALTKRVKWFVDGTTLVDGTPLASCVPGGNGPAELVLPGFVAGNTATGMAVSQGGSQSTDVAVHQSAYIVGHSGGPPSVISNCRVDTIIYNSPGSFVWGGLDRLIWAGIQTPTAASPAQHVGRYIQTLRSNVTTGTDGLPLPQPQLWAACLEFRDESGQPSSATNAGLTVEMDWYGNGLDDANSRTIQSLVIGQHNPSGPPVEVSSIIGVWLGQGSTGSAKTVFEVSLPFSTAVLDTTNATQINNAPAIRLAAGQSIAFEGTNSNRLVYDSATTTLRWTQGALSYPVGKGICVGWLNVYSASATLPNYIAGNIIFLTGAGSYAITLPAATSVAAGTGFTFSATGTGSVGILPAGSDRIDLGPVTLRTNDRYHIVSDGLNTWHEVFRTNSVAPVFTGAPVLPSYAVAALPGGATGGAQAFAVNGRKAADVAGAGTGVEVFYDGQHWISVCSGSVVSA